MLDNPIWAALTTRQAHFALGGVLAKRYPSGMAPFIAIGDTSAANLAAMAPLAQPGETLSVVGLVPDSAPDGWTVERTSAVSQMVYNGRGAAPPGDDIVALSNADVTKMLALTALVYPEYFRPRTIEMGLFLGIRREGQLIAMAGQRFSLQSHREISAVCTHPDFRGRGHATRLIACLVDAILREGLTPFLHVDADNAGARAAYEKAGFAWRRDLKMVRLKR